MSDPQAEVIAFLAAAATHGGTAPKRVDTHGAVVFLAGERVYKLKRAVRYPYLDYSTVEKRRGACEAEVAVNRRTAPGLYLGVVPVTRAGATLHLGREGDAADWVVVMRRFDEDATLDRLAERAALTLDHIERVADAIAALHAKAERRTNPAASASMGEIAAQNADLLRQAPILDAANVEALVSATARQLATHRALLDRRRADGAVRRGHGDLHLRNICMIDGRPTLFDALEFDERLATVDVLYDLAFLLMDLWRRGLKEHANRLFNRYLEQTGDYDGLAALPLFLSVRAAIRAHVAVAAGSATENTNSAAAEARAYLALAGSVLVEAPPMLVAIGGWSGTGKTTQARVLAPALGRTPGAVILRSDVTRKRLAGVGELDRLPESGYAEDVTARVYATLGDNAGRCIRAGQAAIVDAVAARPHERAALEQVGRSAGVPFAGIWLDAPLDVRTRRVEARINDASDAGREVAEQQARLDAGAIAWERATASKSAAETARAVAAAIRARNPVTTLRVLFDAATIAARVQRMAAEVAAAAPADVVAIGVLKGAFVFLADLVRALDGCGVQPEVEFLRLSSYGRSQHSAGAIRLLGEPPSSVTGRTVLVVDDIADSGLSLTYARDFFLARGAAQVLTAVLLDKPSRRKVAFQPDFTGFVIEDVFVVGYGLDDAERHRHLPYLAVASTPG